MSFARRLPKIAALVVLVGGVGCEPSVSTTQPDNFIEEIAIPTAEDLDPDPNVLEVEIVAKLADLEISPGVTSTVWTYNGSVPGPLLRLRAGDTLRVRFRNELPEPTTIHWHGIRVPNEMDGMPGHSQGAVAPGASFEYEFVVPDEGTFWYHPHVDDAAQLGYGLYGAIVVEPANEPKEGVRALDDLGDEVVMVLSDMSLDEDGVLAPPDQGGDLATVFGREGNHVLLNGKVAKTIHARNGRRQLWRIVNAARSRYFQLELEGHELLQIGGQAGLLPEPRELERIVLTPGERAEVLVTPRGASGEQLSLEWVPFDRGYGSTEFREPITIATVALEGDPIEPTPNPESLGPTVEPLDLGSATPVDIRLTLGQTPDSHPVMGINGVPYPEAPPVYAEVGETQLWTITNEMDWDHPFHLHGFFFQVLGADNQPVYPVEWRDTVNVPRGGQPTKVVVRYDNRPGSWMFHCHILDHADHGMMGVVELMRR